MARRPTRRQKAALGRRAKALGHRVACPYRDSFTASAPRPYRHHPLGETGWGVGATPVRPTRLAGGYPRIRGSRFQDIPQNFAPIRSNQ